VNAAAVAWALRRALRVAIATAVVALLFATTLSGEGAERLATTAYLAAIFAGVALIVARFLPQPAPESAIPERAFPVFIAFLFGVGALVGAGVALASLPGAEALAIIASFALVAVTALARSGSLAALNAALVRYGAVAAVTRYAIALALCALAVAALFGSEAAANLAYRLAFVAALGLCVTLIAPTRAGLFLRELFARSGSALDRLGDTFSRERIAGYATAIAVAALISAMLLARDEAEPLAIAAWVAAAAATLAVAVECRRLRG
jgi:hypothetical protein